jgi:hypothetical protein
LDEALEEMILEDFINEEVLDQFVEEEASEISHEVLNEYDTKLRRKTVRDVSTIYELYFSI